jgi:hypothetical protein
MCAVFWLENNVEIFRLWSFGCKAHPMKTCKIRWRWRSRWNRHTFSLSRDSTRSAVAPTISATRHESLRHSLHPTVNDHHVHYQHCGTSPSQAQRQALLRAAHGPKGGSLVPNNDCSGAGCPCCPSECCFVVQEEAKAAAVQQSRVSSSQWWPLLLHCAHNSFQA